MTGRTAFKHSPRLDVVFFCKTFATLSLIRRWCPRHIEDLTFRPQSFFRIAMAFQTPLHLQRADLHHKRHLIDAPVTGRASNAFTHVNAVVEINKIGQIMHACPSDWLACSITCANRFEIGAILPDLRMAIHADSCWRNSGGGSFFDGSVAISAVEPNITDMMLVAELHRLLASNEGVRYVVGTVELSNCEKRTNDDKESPKYCDSRERIRTTVKDLRHPVGLIDLNEQSVFRHIARRSPN
jgi:hypothetical protein